MGDVKTVRAFLQHLLVDLVLPNGAADIERFPSLRAVDAKVREVKTVLESVAGQMPDLLSQMNADPDFKENSRRIRLEALAHYCRSVVRFIDSGIGGMEKLIAKPPDLTRLVGAIPDLKRILESRWLEAQACQHTGAYLAAVVMMGSVLEGLLFAIGHNNRPQCYRAARAPKTKDGKQVHLEDWNLNSLIDVTVELGWIKTDRGQFSHALRQSRNVVHPWEHMVSRADFDEATCRTCWHVLNAAGNDLLRAALYGVNVAWQAHALRPPLRCRLGDLPDSFLTSRAEVIRQFIDPARFEDVPKGLPIAATARQCVQLGATL